MGIDNSERYEISKREAINLLGMRPQILMRRPDGSTVRNMTRRRALTAIGKSVIRIYIQNSIDGDVVIIVDVKGDEWIYDAPTVGHQHRERGNNVQLLGDGQRAQ